jgi:hypothetical protein
MKRSYVIGAVAVAVGALAAGGWWFFQVRAAAPLRAKKTHLAVRWHGKYRGGMALPARINWCPGTRRGVLEAVSGDSGVAIVLYERDSLTSGAHVIASPDMAASIVAPGATAVMRWMRADRDTAVTGFRSQSGTVRIQFAGGTGSGELSARMRSSTGTDTLVLEGAFLDVPVITTAAGCS